MRERNYIQEVSLLEEKLMKDPQRDWQQWKIIWDRHNEEEPLNAGDLVNAIEDYLRAWDKKKYNSIFERYMIWGLIAQLERVDMEEVKRFVAVLTLIRLHTSLTDMGNNYFYP